MGRVVLLPFCGRRAGRNHKQLNLQRSGESMAGPGDSASQTHLQVWGRKNISLYHVAAHAAK